MNAGAEAVIEQADAYAALFEHTGLGRSEAVSSDVLMRDLTERDLVAATSSISRLIRLAEAERVKLAGEIARRSEDRESSLARKYGASTAANLVAQLTGVPRAHAGTMVWSGEAFRMRDNPITGELLSPRFPQIAAALGAGLLDPEVAAAMRRALVKAAPGLAPFELDRLEAKLIAFASEGWDADTLLAFLKQVPETAHPDGGQPGAGTPAPTPTVRRKPMQNGLIRWVLELDALTDGFLKTAVDANTSLDRPVLHTPDEPEPDPDTTDRRPREQRLVDGIRLVAKKALKVDDGQVGGTAVTMLVTITETALRTGVGTAQLLDCGSEITASVARILAAEAEIIPVVLGGNSQPLDLGIGRRYFSEAQRRAMAVRDGGCVGPGCAAPPSWCDGAHIRPAGYGPTDLDNGVLLCWWCHLLHDEHGWQLDRVDGRWWWIPPPHVDPTGRRRPGGRIPPITLD